jgi:hypothetical protein
MNDISEKIGEHIASLIKANEPLLLLNSMSPGDKRRANLTLEFRRHLGTVRCKMKLKIPQTATDEGEIESPVES